MSIPQFVDISSWQPRDINWKEYVKWAASFDGVSHVSLRSSQGVGFKDNNYDIYKAGFLSAGGNVIIHYHYAYPQYSGPVDEANYQHSIIGSLKDRPQDIIMIDVEENTPAVTPEWVYQWGKQAMKLYGRKPNIYASDYYIRQKLQDKRLPEVLTLTLANWQFHPTERPACPPPWSEYLFLQYSDKVTVPGIGTTVDGDIFLGKEYAPPIKKGTTKVATPYTTKDQQGNEIPFIPAPPGHANAHMMVIAKRGQEMFNTRAQVELPGSAEPVDHTTARYLPMPSGGLMQLAENLFPEDVKDFEAMTAHVFDLFLMNRDKIRTDTDYTVGEMMRVS